MPRQPRIDSPDLLHHVIVRGIERRKIFIDDEDRDSFVERLRKLLLEAGSDCYAWALIRYIHLNSIRANLVNDLEILDHYPWCGHAEILGNTTKTGLATD